MPVICLETKIKSSINICFDLSRSIDLHQVSTAKSKEKAIEGTTRGLIKMGESVTWEAIHFGIRQKLASKITRFNQPYHFRDEQLKGPFKLIIHDHSFEEKENCVIMKDRFEFQSPGGLAGNLFNALILTRYMRKLLTERNQIIKHYAETDKWKLILENQHH